MSDDAELDFRKIHLTVRPDIHQKARPEAVSDDIKLSDTVELTAEQRDKLFKPVSLEARVAEIEMKLDDVGIVFLNDWCKMVEHDLAKLVERVDDIEKIIKDGEVFDPYDEQLGMLKRINELDGHLIELMGRRISVLERKVF